jgi:hypothetical protein
MSPETTQSAPTQMAHGMKEQANKCSLQYQVLNLMVIKAAEGTPEQWAQARTPLHTIHTLRRGTLESFEALLELNAIYDTSAFTGVQSSFNQAQRAKRS